MTQETAPSEPEPDDPDTEFVEIDPSHRYGRYKEILGKGAFKKVYKAFDEIEGIEVAWNQVKVADLLRNSVDLERLYSEVHLLKTLKHKNIIKFYNSWIDTKNEHINFITEIFTSGTLRQYRTKHKHVDLRALKKWSKQILEGLFYLHSHDPPVIHRDLKCDNIFVNGNQGEVKIGDLGLATILQQARSAHSVIGTPEFMAPELYEEEYNELVDIYAFGMCLLELVTLEYPYVECANAAQIYKKVTSGIKPASLDKVTDPTVKAFIKKCISEVSSRLSAEELLLDPFLHPDEESESASRLLRNKAKVTDSCTVITEVGSSSNSVAGCSSNPVAGCGSNPTDDNANEAIDSSVLPSRGLVVEGERKDVDIIFVKLRIVDPTGRLHNNIHFPFDIESDTAITVAREMVEELALSDHDVPTIAAMIKSEIRSHIPGWVSSLENLSEDTTETEPASESKDDASPMRNEASPLALEILPSGRKYWSDTHRSLGGASPSKFGNSHLVFQGSSLSTNPVEGESSNAVHSLEQVQAETMPCDDDMDEAKKVGKHGDPSEITEMAQKLENLLLNQHNEICELESKHELQRLEFLDQISPETREQILSVCKLKIPGYGKP